MATADYRAVFNALRESRQQKIKSIDAVSEDVLKRLVDFIRKGSESSVEMEKIVRHSDQEAEKSATSLDQNAEDYLEKAQDFQAGRRDFDVGVKAMARSAAEFGKVERKSIAEAMRTQKLSSDSNLFGKFQGARTAALSTFHKIHSDALPFLAALEKRRASVLAQYGDSSEAALSALKDKMEPGGALDAVMAQAESDAEAGAAGVGEDRKTILANVRASDDALENQITERQTAASLYKQQLLDSIYRVTDENSKALSRSGDHTTEQIKGMSPVMADLEKSVDRMSTDEIPKRRETVEAKEKDSTELAGKIEEEEKSVGEKEEQVQAQVQGDYLDFGAAISAEEAETEKSASLTEQHAKAAAHSQQHGTVANFGAGEKTLAEKLAGQKIEFRRATRALNKGIEAAMAAMTSATSARKSKAAALGTDALADAAKMARQASAVAAAQVVADPDLSARSGAAAQAVVKSAADGTAGQFTAIAGRSDAASASATERAAQRAARKKDALASKITAAESQPMPWSTLLPSVSEDVAEKATLSKHTVDP